MSGIELFDKLRADGNPIAIILITARISQAMVAQAQTAGVLAVLEKPFRAAELLKAVKDATKP